MNGKGVIIAVEGQTERIFVQRYLTHHLIPNRGYSLAIQRLRGEGLEQLQISTNSTAPDFDVLLVDCEGDDKVLSFILERIEGWISKGYQFITGLRDLFPAPPGRLNAMEASAKSLLQSFPVDAGICFAVMEIEAWFLVNYAHLTEIDPRLTTQLIQQNTGVNISTLAFEADHHPTSTLRAILRIVDLEYSKREGEVYRTVTRLDFNYLYIDGRALAPRLGEFFDRLDNVFS